MECSENIKISKLYFNILMLLVVIIITIIFIIKLSGNNLYMDANKDKIENIRNTINQDNRIIFIGGSNLAFGLDSKLIEENFKEYDVINLGLHAGVGLKYMLDSIKEFLKEGDIIIISPEYEHFYDNLFYGEVQLLEAVVSYPKSIVLLDKKQIQNSIINFNNFIFNRCKVSINNILNKRNDIYSREYFDYNGDLTSHLNKKSIDYNNLNIILDGNKVFNKEVINYINEYSIHLENIGVKVYYAYPPIPQDKFNKVNLEEVKNEIDKQLKITVISDSNANIYDKNMFFDTAYHLNYEGRYERTKNIINALEKEIN